MGTTYEDILDYPLYSYDWATPTGNRYEDQIAEHLTLVDDVSVNDEAYQFDYVRFYVRKADGQVLYGHDSGCSCPYPFEDYLVKDLQETALDGVEAAVLGHYSPDWNGGVSRAEIQRRIREVKSAIKAAGGK